LETSDRRGKALWLLDLAPSQPESGNAPALGIEVHVSHRAAVVKCVGASRMSATCTRAACTTNVLFCHSGGLELLFGGVKTHELDLPAADKWTVGTLIPWMKDNLLRERPELFVKGHSV
jgi:hypothetical protein